VAGTYTSAQSVTLADTTPGAILYYTTNGTTPTTSSATSEPIAVGSTETIQAIAVAGGYANSAVGTAVYTIGTGTTVAATPTFSPAAGTYTSAQSVTLSDTTPGAIIYYTTNGTTPTVSSAQYIAGTPLSISATTTIQAIAVASGYANSAVTSGTYTLTGGTSSVNLSAVDNMHGIASNCTAAISGG
jgi:hypothetical protein